MKDTVSSMVPIKLDKQSHLFYSMKGFLYLAEKYGDANAAFSKVPAGSNAKMDAEGITALVDLIYAGLVHEDDTLTPDKVAAIVDVRRLGTVAEKISKAMSASLPESDGDEGDPQ